MPDLRRSGRGDHFVAVKVIVPNKLSAAQRRAVQQLAKVFPASNDDDT